MLGQVFRGLILLLPQRATESAEKIIVNHEAHDEHEGAFKHINK